MSDALVLIDLVNDLVSPEGKLAKSGTPAHVAEQGTIAHAKAALDHARSTGAKVIFVRVCFSEGFPELEGVNAPFYALHRANNWLLCDTWGTEFQADIQPLPTEVVIEKSRVNPFTNPAFEQELAGIDRILISGVNTILAVDETVRTAAAKGFDVVVLEDACASTSAEIHNFALANILNKFATIEKTADYLAE